jgi:signal transduction histidine kinase
MVTAMVQWSVKLLAALVFWLVSGLIQPVEAYCVCPSQTIDSLLESGKDQPSGGLKNGLPEKDSDRIRVNQQQQTEVMIGVVVILFLFMVLIIGLIMSVKQKQRDNDLIRMQNERLEHQTRLLKESSQVRNTLVDVLGHDLRSLAGSVVGLSEILLEEQAGNRHLQAIHHSGEKLIRIINQTSLLGEIREDEPLLKTETSCRKILLEAIEDNEDIIREMGVVTELRVDDSVLIRANPIIVSIFRNLVQNAVKYGSAGGRILVGAVELAQGWKVYVSDFGETIPAAKRETIFDRNIRLQESKGGGSGLGLFISKMIARAHHAEIGVEPNVPNGNTFYVILPK